MSISIGILAIGSELLDGRVHESNSRFVAQQIADLGVSLHTVMQCDDVVSEITAALTFLATRVDLIIISGGLGPTTDDLTREAVAALMNQPLEQDAAILGWMEELFRRRNRSFDPTNAKQALFPRGSTIIPNPVGTAAGFELLWESSTKRNVRVAALPGVPREFQAMFMASLFPRIVERCTSAAGMERRVMRVFGLAESVIGGRVERCVLPGEITVSYRAAFPEIQVVLKAPQGFPDLDRLAAMVREAIGEEYIFADQLDSTFEQCVQSLLISRGITVSGAESCTGGLLSAFLTETSGASACFLGSVVSYANSAKESLLDVSPGLIKEEGAVSAAVAEAMARGARIKFGSDIAVSVTGIAGPTGGSDEKPVGTFFVGIATASGEYSSKLFFAGTRSIFRRYVAFVALDMIRRHLCELPASTYGVQAKP